MSPTIGKYDCSCPICADVAEAGGSSVELQVSGLETVLEEAARIVDGDRQDAYGHPADDYGRTAALWSAYLDIFITAEQAVVCMALMKLSRQAHKAGRDNLVDAAGYLRCAEKIRARAGDPDMRDTKAGA